jgi:hypothetical protein
MVWLSWDIQSTKTGDYTGWAGNRTLSIWCHSSMVLNDIKQDLVHMRALVNINIDKLQLPPNSTQMCKCKLCYKFCVTILPCSWGNPSHQLELVQRAVQHSVWKHQHQCQRGDCQWAQHCCQGAYDGPLCSPTPPLLLLSLLIPLQLYGTAKHSKSKKLLEETTPFWPASVFLLRWQTE